MKRVLASLSVAMVLPNCLLAEGAWSLADLEAKAEANSFDLELLKTEKRVLGIVEGARIRDFLPQFSVSYRQNKTVAQRDYDQGNHSVQLSVTQPIYDGGKARLALDMARLELKSAEERFQQARIQLRLQVRQAYFKVQQNRANVSAARAGLVSSSALLRKSEIERKQGEITELDLREIQNENHNRILSVKKAEAAWSDSLTDLAVLVRVPAFGASDVKHLDLSSIRVKPLDLTRQELFNLAMERRPDVHQAKLDMIRSQKQAEVASNHLMPTIAVTGRYGRTGDQWPPTVLEWGIGLNVSFNIFGNSLREDFTDNRAKNDTSRGISTGGQFDVYDKANWREAIVRSEMDFAKSKKKDEDTTRDAGIQIDRAMRDLRDRSRAVDLADEALAVRERRFLIEGKKYEKGEITIHQLLEEELKLANARLGLVRERVDYAMAVNQFEATMGLELNELGLLEYQEFPSDVTDEIIRKSWESKTKIEIPALPFRSENRTEEP